MKKISAIFFFFLVALVAQAQEKEPIAKPVLTLWVKSSLNYTNQKTVRDKLSDYRLLNEFTDGVFQGLGLEYRFWNRLAVELNFQYSDSEKRHEQSAVSFENKLLSGIILYDLYQTPRTIWRPYFGFTIRKMEIEAYKQDTEKEISFDDYIHQASQSVSLSNTSLGVNLGLAINKTLEINKIKQGWKILYAFKIGAYLPFVDMGWSAPTLVKKLSNVPDFYQPTFIVGLDFGIPFYKANIIK